MSLEVVKSQAGQSPTASPVPRHLTKLVVQEAGCTGDTTIDHSIADTLALQGFQCFLAMLIPDLVELFIALALAFG